jgi:phage gp45-like
VLGFVGGARNLPICWQVDDGRYRPKGLPAGAVCLYSMSSPQARIVLLPNGTAEIVGAVTFKNSITVEGNIHATGDVAAGALPVGVPGAITLAGHAHISAAPGSPTGPPIPLP